MLVFLCGCASEVTSIRDEAEAVLDRNEGYLLMEVDTTHNLEAIHIVGPRHIKLTRTDLRTGSNYILVSLPAGRYRIDSVNRTQQYYYALVGDNWDFQVREGAISYIGNLTFKGDYWGFSGSFALINRSSFALEYLEKNFPGLLETRPLVFGGPGDDGFFEAVARQ